MLETLAYIALGVCIGIGLTVHIAIRYPPRARRRPLEPLPKWPRPLSEHIRSAIKDHHQRSDHHEQH